VWVVGWGFCCGAQPPTPKSPIPNPQSPFVYNLLIKIIIIIIKNIKKILL
jgi:hypothetical protein